MKRTNAPDYWGNNRLGRKMKRRLAAWGRERERSKLTTHEQEWATSLRPGESAKETRKLAEDYDGTAAGQGEVDPYPLGMGDEEILWEMDEAGIDGDVEWIRRGKFPRKETK